MADRNRNQMPRNLTTRILNMFTVPEAERGAMFVFVVCCLTLNIMFISKPPGGLDNNGHSRMDEGAFSVCVICVPIALSMLNILSAVLLRGIPRSRILYVVIILIDIYFIKGIGIIAPGDSGEHCMHLAAGILLIGTPFWVIVRTMWFILKDLVL